MNRYLYRPLLRPAVFAGLPAGWEYVEVPASLADKRPDLPVSKFPHGIIAYRRPLSEAEIMAHDLGVDTVNLIPTHASFLASIAFYSERHYEPETWARLWQDIARAYRGEFLSDNEMDDLTSRWPA